MRGTPRYQEWIASAEGLVPLPRRIRVIEGTPCGYGGCAFPGRTPPAVAIDYTPYLWECAEPGCEAEDPLYDYDRHLERTIFIHELGHIWDLERGAKRNRWHGYRDNFRSLLGLNPKPRWLSRPDFYEAWADAYAWCVTGRTVYRRTTTDYESNCRSLKELP